MRNILITSCIAVLLLSFASIMRGTMGIGSEFIAIPVIYGLIEYHFPNTKEKENG